MYSVSEAYLEQMMKRGTRRRLTGTIGSVSFTGADIVRDSFSVSGRCTEESDTKIGGVYLGEIELTFVPSFLSKVARDQYFGKQVSVSIGLYVETDEDVWEWEDVPIGVYTLEAPKISKQGISVTGYDNLQKLDKKFNIDQSTGTIYSFLSYIATECNVTLGQTQEEIEALPNGTELLSIYEENDIETFRDFLYWIAQTCGCFACADREGNIVLRKFGVSNDVEIDEEHRDIDVVFSGYITKWTGVSFVDIKDKMTRYYGLEVDDGLTMNLGSNPLLQSGTAEAVERRRRAVLNAVADIQYTPFYVNSARDCIFDLGDEMSFTGGISGNSTGCVMAYSYSLDNYNFEGYGDDPSLANARSKIDKNIAGLLQSTTENEVTYYNYANLDEITFGSDQEVTVASLAFTSAQETTVKILHEFIFDMVKDLSEAGSYEVRYYLDNELISYKPYESLSAINITTDIPDEEESESEPIQSEIEPIEASICRDFFYILKNVTPNVRHTWQVKVLAHGIDSVTIQANHAHVTLEGQRLYGETYWDGFLDLTDNFDLVRIGYFGLVSITDSCSVTVADNIIESLSDSIELYDMATMQVLPITDSVSILMEFLGLETEDSEGFLTEDGEVLITNG